jgi:tetratricopeptide (TPR) repeat protein
MFYLLPVGRWREAAAEHERGLEDDPLSFSGRLQLAMCFMQTNRFVEAEMEFRKVMKSYESAFQPRMFLALAFAAQEKLTEAVTFAEQAYSLAPWHSHSASVLAGLLVRAGNLSRAEELIRKLGSPQTYGVPTAMTFFHLLCGELNSATEWSEKAIEQRDPRMVLGMQLPMAAAFRADPRGRAILRKMNLPEAG